MPKYSIIRVESFGSKVPDRVVVSDIEGYPEADRQRNRLQSEDNEAHPTLSSWTRTLFIVQMDS
jgi:hypothetical protein